LVLGLIPLCSVLIALSGRLISIGFHRRLWKEEQNVPTCRIRIGCMPTFTHRTATTDPIYDHPIIPSINQPTGYSLKHATSVTSYIIIEIEISIGINKAEFSSVTVVSSIDIQRDSDPTLYRSTIPCHRRLCAQPKALKNRSDL